MDNRESFEWSPKVLSPQATKFVVSPEVQLFSLSKVPKSLDEVNIRSFPANFLECILHASDFADELMSFMKEDATIPQLVDMMKGQIARMQVYFRRPDRGGLDGIYKDNYYFLMEDLNTASRDPTWDNIFAFAEYAEQLRTQDLSLGEMSPPVKPSRYFEDTTPLK
jgi:hypothetical protein